MGNVDRLRRITEDETAWPALVGLRPDDVGPYGEYTVTNDRRIIYDFATLAGADDPDAGDVAGLIAELADPTSLYDTVAVLCRELLRLRLEVAETRQMFTSSTN